MSGTITFGNIEVRRRRREGRPLVVGSRRHRLSMQVLLPLALVALALALAAVPVSGLTVPSAPLNLAAVAGDQQVTLTWDPPPTDGGSAITNYFVYRDTVPGLGFD